MPVNAGPEYYNAEKKYADAKTKEDKVKALEEMIRTLPKHKSSENLLASLKKRLSKLKKEKTVQAKAKPKFSISKDGAAQVCIFGFTNSGKSTLLKQLTNANVEIGNYSYTTAKPTVGMLDYTGVKIQLVEIPSTFSADVMSIVRTCDLLLILLNGTNDLESQLSEIIDILDEHGIDDKNILIVSNKSDKKKNEHVLEISAKSGDGFEELTDAIWGSLNLIRVYTKSPNTPKSKKPLTLEKGSTVKDVTKSVHKTLLKNFRFARIFNDTKYSGRQVGLEYVLSDLDTVEIHS